MRSFGPPSRNRGGFRVRKRDWIFISGIFIFFALFYIESRTLSTAPRSVDSNDKSPSIKNQPTPPPVRERVVEPDAPVSPKINDPEPTKRVLPTQHSPNVQAPPPIVPNVQAAKPREDKENSPEGKKKQPVEAGKTPDVSPEERRAMWKERRFAAETPHRCSKKTIKRDYEMTPVSNSGNGWDHCDVRCVSHDDSAYADIGAGGECSKQSARTMENVGGHIGDDDRIYGNTRLEADVTMQYFSYFEYDYMEPIRNKTEESLAVAMISNCGPQYRLNYIKDLQSEGIKIDTYGACFPVMKSKDNIMDRLNSKIDVIGKYKFVMSFENSQTEDYVTEKLFGPLVASSVPIYHGAPNGKIFAPKHSTIFAEDFKSAADMAKYLKYLDKNNTAYLEYTKWKEGPDEDWLALMDLSIVHSACRFCIRSADIDRKQVGEVLTGPYINDNIDLALRYEGTNAKLIKVRERGTFYMRWIYLDKGRDSFDDLETAIMDRYSTENPKVGRVHTVYKLWDRKKTPIHSDSEVRGLIDGEELEIIFTKPASLDRAHYTKWYYKKHGLTLPAGWEPR